MLIKAFFFAVLFPVIVGLGLAGVLLIAVGGPLIRRRKGEGVIADPVEAGYSLLETLRMRVA